MNLKLFNDPHVIRSTRRLLLEFFGRFTHLLPYKHAIPNPALDCDLFPQALPRFLEHRREGIPECMYQAMADVEASAFEKRPRFEAALHQDPDLAAFTEAIEHWLRQNPPTNGHPSTPPEFQQEETELTEGRNFEGNSATQNTAPAPPPPIENQNPKIQNSSLLPLLPPVKNPEPTQATAPAASQPAPASETLHSALCTPHSGGPSLLPPLPPVKSPEPTQATAPVPPPPATAETGEPATFNLQPSTPQNGPLPPVQDRQHPSALYILNTLVLTLNRFAILPKWAAEAIALFIFHTY
ncbi:MAG TPA: hypothetical protein VN578_21240, partial [Candidatus Binatia bacterium]|nr:hypothetical protein [Candidatus Binatia bacterium]